MGASLLTPALHQSIVATLDLDESYKTAAAVAGISKRTLQVWRKRGEDAHNAVDVDGQEEPREADIPESERPYWRLWRDCENAVASRRARWLEEIARQGMNHQAVTTTVTEEALVVNGKVAVGEDGEPIMTRKTVTKTEPQGDWRALMTLLERFYPAEFARVSKLEHSGRDGEPIEMNLADKRAKARSMLEERWERLQSAEPSTN